MGDEIKEITPDVEDDKPLEVTIKKDKEIPEPDFDYDDYLPTEEEIMQAEQEIEQQIAKRQAITKEQKNDYKD